MPEFNDDADKRHHDRMMADTDSKYRDIYNSDLSNEAIYNAMRASFETDLSRYELVLTACESGWTLALLNREIAL